MTGHGPFCIHDDRVVVCLDLWPSGPGPRILAKGRTRPSPRTLAVRCRFHKSLNSYAPIAYPNPGETVGKYIVERMLGEGGMGAVARGKHKITLAPAALKFMSPAFLKIDGAVQRFLNESRAAGRIRSEHVVTIYDVGELPNGAPYIAMEYLEGKDLQQLIESEGLGGLAIERAIFLVTQVLAGLQAAHGNGVIHRDMKPSNCFIIKRSGEEFVKLLDFGISKIVEPGKKNLTQTNSALGTPLYMAPEQASSPKDVDQRSDLYAVGTLLYEMLTGATPFTSETGELAEILYKIFTADVPNLRIRRADAPVGLADVVQKVLSRSPADRYPTALDFAEALAPYGDARVARLVQGMREYVPPEIGDVTEVTAMEAFRQEQARSGSMPAIGPAGTHVLPGSAATQLDEIPKSAKVPGNFTVPYDNSKSYDAKAFKRTTPIAISNSEPQAPALTKSDRGRPLILVGSALMGVLVVAVVGFFVSRTKGPTAADAPLSAATSASTAAMPPPSASATMEAVAPSASSTVAAASPDAGLPPNATATAKPSATVVHTAQTRPPPQNGSSGVLNLKPIN